MNENSRNNGTTSVDHSSVEQQLNLDNYREETSIENHTNAKEIVKEIKIKKEIPKTPSTLYVSHFSFQLFFMCIMF
jgi:hypothetical protein